MKKKIGFGIAGGIISLVAIGFLYYYFRINVLDKIAFLSQMPVLEPFQEIEEMEWVGYDDFPQYEFFGGLSLPYKEEYLRPEVEAELYFPTDQRYIKIHSNVELSKNPDRKTLIIFSMTYNPQDRSLTLGPMHISDWDLKTEPHTGGHYEDRESIIQYLEEYNVTEEDIRAYQDYVLYEVVLKTWVNTHGGNYEWEKEKLGRCEIVDQTFDFLKE